MCSPDRDVHSLVIRSACHAHGGVYKAVISNKVGKSACYAHLYVTGSCIPTAAGLLEKNADSFSKFVVFDEQILFLTLLTVLQLLKPSQGKL